MHDGMQHDPILGQVQGHKPLKVGNPFSKATFSTIYNGSWQLTTESQNGTMSKYDQARFLIFGVVFVSRDVEVG